MKEKIFSSIYSYNNSLGIIPLEPYILEKVVRFYLDKGIDNLSVLRPAYQSVGGWGRTYLLFGKVAGPVFTTLASLFGCSIG